MILVLICCIVLYVVDHGDCRMESKIQGGKLSNIGTFPHVAALAIKCLRQDDEDDLSYFVCGSSIINQYMILTAAHCVDGCLDGSSIIASVGHSDKTMGVSRNIKSYFMHEKYHISITMHDIALGRLKAPLTFSSSVSRISLMKSPPYFEEAQIAGWGFENETSRILSDHLKNIDQKVWRTKQCEEKLGSHHKGNICASSGRSEEYPSGGDSGSALVVRGYIQVGIVSHKFPSIDRSVIVYTDTGYYYDWIMEKSKEIMCPGKGVILRA